MGLSIGMRPHIGKGAAQRSRRGQQHRLQLTCKAESMHQECEEEGKGMNTDSLSTTTNGSRSSFSCIWFRFWCSSLPSRFQPCACVLCIGVRGASTHAFFTFEHTHALIAHQKSTSVPVCFLLFHTRPPFAFFFVLALSVCLFSELE